MRVTKRIFLIESDNSKKFEKKSGLEIIDIKIEELYLKKEEFKNSIVFVENIQNFKDKMKEIVTINPSIHLILFFVGDIASEELIGFMKTGILESVNINDIDGINSIIKRYRKESHLLKLNYYNNLIKKFQNIGIITKSLKMGELFACIDKIADTNATCMIHGESGTGKELVAKSIHHFGKRKPNRFVAVNTGAIPDNLLEVELFGHKKGAFTSADMERKGKFEYANNGSIFLDEISSMSINLQVKLLRVLQEREIEKIGDNKTIKIDVRVIVATNKDLKEMVKNGSFREDLYYRLNVIPIYLPPLRNRKKDIPILANYFSKKYCKMNEIKPKSFTISALRVLQEYSWPGNIRELENIVERMVILNQEKSVLFPKDIPEEIKVENVFTSEKIESVSEEIPEEGLYLNKILHSLEKKLILKSLKKTAGNKKQAANLLKIKRTTLIEKIKKYQNE